MTNFYSWKVGYTILSWSERAFFSLRHTESVQGGVMDSSSVNHTQPWNFCWTIRKGVFFLLGLPGNMGEHGVSSSHHATMLGGECRGKSSQNYGRRQLSWHTWACGLSKGQNQDDPWTSESQVRVSSMFTLSAHTSPLLLAITMSWQTQAGSISTNQRSSGAFCFPWYSIM